MGRPEIAAALGIDEETVKLHTRMLRRKTGARTLAQAVAIACREGVLTFG